MEPVSGLVLDVGGSQLPVRDRVKHSDETTFHLLDLEYPHEGTKPAIVQDLNEVMNANSTAWADRFDHAFCLEVSEYWWNPSNALRVIANMLKPGGKIHISFHFYYPVHNPPKLDYLRYTEAGAVRLLHEAGFSIERIVPRMATSGAMFDFIRQERMRPAKDSNILEVGCLITAVKK